MGVPSGLDQDKHTLEYVPVAFVMFYTIHV